MKKSSLIKTLSIGAAVFCVTVCTQMTARYAPFYDGQRGFVAEADSKEQPAEVEKEAPMKKQTTLTEAEILRNLDKETRAVYYSLTDEAKKYARDKASENSDFRGAVESAVKYEAEKRAKMNNRMLHNGMDRIPEKK